MTGDGANGASQRPGMLLSARDVRELAAAAGIHPSKQREEASTALIDAAQASSIGFMGANDNHWRMAVAGMVNAPPGSHTVSQNSRRRGMRSSGAFPAMIAALIAPIEMPAYQLGRMPASCKPSYTPH